jgi:hypothetical protein
VSEADTRARKPGRSLDEWVVALAIALTFFVQAAAFAQSPVRPELSTAAFLLGKWQGAGWIEFVPGRRAEFNQFETITSKLGGGAIVMEGIGTRKGGESDGSVTHEAIGILTYDATQKKPLLRAYRTGGQFVDADVTLEPNKLTWQFQIPGLGTTRYTIVLDDKGRWFEVGELSKDGGEWRKFFETSLSRVGSP